MAKKIKKAKPVAKKAPAKKQPVKKIVKKAVKKAAPKKSVKPVKKVVKKTTVKKAAPKKAAVKKAAPAKKVVKKAVKAKAPVAKKAPAKKTAAKKIVKKAAPKTTARPAKKEVKKYTPEVKPFIKKATPSFSAGSAKADLLTDAEIKEIKKNLIEMRDDAIARLKDKKEMDMPENIGGDPIDTATQSLDKEMLFELTDSSQNLIDQIESALRKIDKGIYGKCESCRVILPKKRIKALPFARYCVSCQSSREG